MTFVSIIVPCYNEEKTIGLLLAAIFAQTYAHENIEVVIADGMSSDGTRVKIAEFKAAHQDLQIEVVNNIKRTIPSGLNVAIAAAHGEIIVRLDAHSAPHPDYVELCVADLKAGLGDNVGGVWEIEPGGSDWMAQSIAVAAAHPLGVGDAKYRYTDTAGEVDTVPFGAFRQQLIEKIGGFDETLLANEDYEFNVRVRNTGGKVWLNPKIRSVYFARPDLVELARQYGRYGYWKVRMLRPYPKTIRYRQALPPLFVLSLLLLGALSYWSSLAGWILGLQVVSYASALLFVGAFIAIRKRSAWLVLGVPLAMATMHVSWGSAFLWSMLSLKFVRKQ